jgi:hypothetical protein
MNIHYVFFLLVNIHCCFQKPERSKKSAVTHIFKKAKKFFKTSSIFFTLYVRTQNLFFLIKNQFEHEHRHAKIKYGRMNVRRFQIDF